MSKKSDYIRDFVKEKLRCSSKWALHGLEVIAGNQTSLEFQKEATTELNRIGFNGRDAKILTSFAKQYALKKYLTVNQMSALHSMMPKYWQQIVSAANQVRLEILASSAEIEDMKKIPEDKLALHIADKWIFDETKVAFLQRLKTEQMVLSI
jgi:hypothetical protein